MKVVLVGGGAANIYLALRLIEKDIEVHLYEKTSSLGKKFLVAGKSGLNITHSEELNEFSKKYFSHADLFEKMLKNFSNHNLIEWLKTYGIETFIGTSKRVFPKNIKAAQILKIWTDKLKSSSNFHLYTQHELTKIAKDKVYFNKNIEVDFDSIVYALGGRSWSKTGSDGKWVELFKEHNINIIPFLPSNCGFETNWSAEFKSKFDRTHLKNIVLSFKEVSVKGELMVTQYGIEGTPVYSLSHYIIDELKQNKQVTVYLDLKPDLSYEAILEKVISKPSKISLSNFLRKQLGLKGIAFSLLKEFTSQEDFKNDIANLIKQCPIVINNSREIEEAISTRGGLDLSEVNDQLELKKLPQHYAIGEMLDWNTITGGYLFQGSFTMGHHIFNVITGS